MERDGKFVMRTENASLSVKIQNLDMSVNTDCCH